jgi:hypothetical protein
MLTTNQVPLITTMSAETMKNQAFIVTSVIQHKSRLTI